MIRVFVCLVTLIALSNAHPGHFEPVYTNDKGIPLKANVILATTKLQYLQADKDIFDINKDVKDDIFDGDILRKDTKSTIINTDYYWDTYAIPITYSDDLGLLARAAIDDARQEYELRTCFMYPYLEDQTNFIYYAPLSGCYSSVGMQGGNQTISIGNGCERVGSIQHEMMHALGIYHEQSRTDRDDYIKIMWSNMYPSTAGNFAKYNYNITNPRRVPYDYNSVMHYSDTGFSKNGQPTIVTLDPAFQDVIGQRRTFSQGDVTKITRMYNCSDTLRISYSCNFEQEAVCGYAQYDVGGDNIDWKIWDNVNPDTENINNKILPSHDATFGVDGIGSYIILDTASFKVENLLGNIKSMRFKSTVETQCLEFSYFFDIHPESTATLSVFLATIDSTNGEILETGTPLVTFDSGSNAINWQTYQISINAPEEYKLMFVGKTGGYQNDVIALDDVSVVDKKCANNMFILNEYTELANQLPIGEGLRIGPFYTAEPGYAYDIELFPNGAGLLDAGYVSMFFEIVQGKYDDELTWPFNNQYIKLKIVDQGPVAYERMSQFSNFLSNATQFPGAFNKPTSEYSNEGVGYGSFMPKSDLETRAFLKLDRLMVEVEVRDMNGFQGSKVASVELLADKTQPATRSNPNPLTLIVPQTRDNGDFNFDHDDEDHDDDDDDDDNDHHDNDDEDDDDEDHDDDDDEDDDDHHFEKPHPKTTTTKISTTTKQTTTTKRDEADGMVSYKMTAFITLLSCLFVFIVMSIVTCVVANSYKKKTRIIMRQYHS